MALATDVDLEKDDTVLEIGCGRGYFTIAAAKATKMVVALDLMDGIGRHGWWRNLEESVKELGLGHEVLPLKMMRKPFP
jgi:cyclopropane fatty-acyl-phospholipid synthase-like methyltransferase